MWLAAVSPIAVSRLACNFQESGMFIINHIILASLWLLFGILHSVLAANWWKRMMQRWLGARYKYYHFAYSVFAALTLMGILVFQYTMQSRLLFTLPGWAKALLGLPV